MTTTRLVRDDDVRAFLTEHGIRVTEQRVIILRQLARQKTPISHQELTDKLSRTSLDRATVYRNLLSLTEAGVLVRTHLGDSVSRFELPLDSSGSHSVHPHFVCTDCGDVACVPKGTVTLKGERMRNRVVEVQLRGRCETCAAE